MVSKYFRAARAAAFLFAVTTAAFSQIGVFGGIQGGMNATRSGTGAPANSLGIDGDLYIDTTPGAQKLYGPKARAIWPAAIPFSAAGAACGAASSSALGCVIVPPNSGLTIDANGNLAVTPGAFLSDPGSNGILMRTALGTTAVATASNLPSGYPYANLTSAPTDLGQFTNRAGYLADPGSNGILMRTATGATAVATGSNLPSGYPYANLSSAPTDLAQFTNNQVGYLAAGTATAASSLLSVSNGTLMEDRSDPAMSTFNVCFHNYAYRPCNVVLLGDSWTEGGGNSVNSSSSYWAVQLRNYLQSNSFYHGTGIIPVHTSTGYWSFGGGTYSSNNLPPTIAGVGPSQTLSGSAVNTFGTVYQVSGVANTMTLGNYAVNGGVPTGTRFYGDNVVIYYATSTDTSAGFTVTVTNTSASGIVTTSTAACGATTTSSLTAARCTVPGPAVSGTTLNWNTVTITPPATGNMYLYGAEFVVLNNTNPLIPPTYTNIGLEVHNLGRGGANSNAFGAGTSTQLAFLPLLAGTNGIQLAVISLGLNDWGQSVPKANYQTNLQNIVSYLQTNWPGISILILDQGNVDTSRYSNANGDTQAQFRDIEKAVAMANGCAFLSISERWGKFTGANANLKVMSADGLHPNDAGYLDIAQMIERRVVESTLAFAQVYPGQTQIVGNQYHNAESETSSTFMGQSAGGTGNFNGSGYNTAMGQNACSSLTIGHNNTCFGQYAGGMGPTTGQFDTVIGSNARVGGNTSYAVQLGGGTNSVNNTAQYQGWNFLDNNGYMNARLIKLGVATVSTAANVTITYGLTHLTGTIAVSTITPPPIAVSGSTFTGCVKIIADNGFSAITGGNITAAVTLAAGSMHDACYDGTSWYIQ